MANNYPELAGSYSMDEYVRDHRNLFINARARGKRGKSRFMLTAKKPLAVFDVDHSAAGVMESTAFKELAADMGFTNVDIRVFPFYYDPALQPECKAQWDAFQDQYVACMQGDYFASIGIDTQDELLQMQRSAWFGMDSVMPVEYKNPNAEFRNLFKLYHKYGKNLIVTTKMGKEYVNKGAKGEWTGGYVPKGFDELEEYLSEVCVELYTCHTGEQNEDGNLVEVFAMQIDKCRVGLGPELVGNVVEQSNVITFPHLAEMIFPDSNVEDWY